MDYIRSFDIRLEKDVYYAGEQICGNVVVENTENIKIKGVRIVLRGKAHAEWKITKSGERRTVRDDQYLLDDKLVVWGKDKHDEDSSIPILPRGIHMMPFKFYLPQTALPCSFESKAGTIRYYLKVVIDIPYACPPQGMKYFTVIGPHIDCMEEKYLSPMVGVDKKTVCCLCCRRGPIALHVTLERTAYVSGENIRLKAVVDNQCDQSCAVLVRLVQHVEYYIDKGVLGVNKNLSYNVLEHRSQKFSPFTTNERFDSTLDQPITLPVVPPSLIGVCRLIQIYYVLKVCLELDRSGEEMNMEFPFTVATVPFRIPNQVNPPQIEYDFCSTHVEGGIYVSPEFQLGQVFDGNAIPGVPGPNMDDVILYRPVYVRIPLRTAPVIKGSISQEKHDKIDNEYSATIENVTMTIRGSGHISPSNSTRGKISASASTTQHITANDELTQPVHNGPSSIIIPTKKTSLGLPVTRLVTQDGDDNVNITSNRVPRPPDAKISISSHTTPMDDVCSPLLNQVAVTNDGLTHGLVTLRNVTLDVSASPRCTKASVASASACVSYASLPSTIPTGLSPVTHEQPSGGIGLTVAETYERSKAASHHSLKSHHHHHRTSIGNIKESASASNIELGGRSDQISISDSPSGVLGFDQESISVETSKI